MMFLNADVGEGLATDKQLFPYLDQANIACGGHAGNQQTMQQAIAACIEHNVTVGGHPSYPDSNNFGRLSMQISPTELTQSLQQQIQSLADSCASLGATLSYVKPHGALYNDIMLQATLFDLVLDILHSYPAKLDLMIGAALPHDYIDKAQQADVRLIREVFADRQYLSNGQLASRAQQGAVFSKVEQICSQVTNLQSGIVVDQQGNTIALKSESVCIHGDNPASVDAIHSIAQILSKQIDKN